MTATVDIRVGNCLDLLREIPDESIQCCVTSPPYWGLRDYGLPPSVWGGNQTCRHDFTMRKISTEVGKGNWSQGTNGRGELQEGGVAAKREPIRSKASTGFCGKCGAWKGCLGLEPTPDLFVTHQVMVFEEVRRVLRKDGTAWVNMGDSYAANHGSGTVSPGHKQSTSKGSLIDTIRSPKQSGLKAKDLCGMPWRLAFALQAAGWYLRCDIIWHKPNPMPESVTDRPTKSHEYIFLLSKGERYYYDAAAIREPVTGNAHLRGNGVNPKAYKTPDGWDTSSGTGAHGTIHREGREKGKYAGNGVAFGHGTDAEKRNRGRVKTPGKNSRIHVDRDPAHELKAKRPRQNDSFSAAVCGLVDDRNKRSVWSVATAPFKEAHFATFPPDLIKPCILAGCMGGGHCPRPLRRLRYYRHGRVRVGSQRHPFGTQPRVCGDGQASLLGHRRLCHLNSTL